MFSSGGPAVLFSFGLLGLGGKLVGALQGPQKKVLGVGKVFGGSAGPQGFGGSGKKALGVLLEGLWRPCNGPKRKFGGWIKMFWNLARLPKEGFEDFGGWGGGSRTLQGPQRRF